MEHAGGLPFSVGRLASFGYGQFRAWKKSGLLMGSAGPKAGGALDVELVNLSGEPVGLAPYRPLPNRSESCAPVELDEGMSRRQWTGFRTCTACTFTDDLLSRALLPIPAAAEIHGLPPCDPGSSGQLGGGTGPSPSATGGVSVAALASASPSVVTGTTTVLSALGADTAVAGEAGWRRPPAVVVRDRAGGYDERAARSFSRSTPEARPMAARASRIDLASG